MPTCRATAKSRCVDRHTYAGMMTALDRNVGRVLDAIAAAELEQNTIVAFLSDNGGPAHDAAGHSRNMADNGPLRGHKFDVLEGGIRTPMMMKWPGRIPSGKKFSGLSSFAWTSRRRSSPPPGFPPRFRNRSTGWICCRSSTAARAATRMPSLFWECNWFGPPDCAARRGHWKIVQLRTGPDGPLADKWELYDLSRDIGEARNVADKNPEIVRELDAAYRSWRSQMARPCTQLSN